MKRSNLNFGNEQGARKQRAKRTQDDMDIKLFSDLIDALGKVAGGLKAIVNLPKAEREFQLCYGKGARP